jgi:hypothetical protein
LKRIQIPGKQSKAELEFPFFIVLPLARQSDVTADGPVRARHDSVTAVRGPT